MPKSLQISQLGDPMLRKEAKEVKNVNGKELQLLMEKMIAAVKEANGVGIAAPQIGKSKRLFIMASYPNPRYPKAPKMKPTAIINPRIIQCSQKKEKDWEGCLSVPGVRALVPRHVSIKAEFTEKSGKKTIKTFKGFLARIFQHEYDHLNGLVFLDRTETTKDIITEKEFQKILESNKKN